MENNVKLTITQEGTGLKMNCNVPLSFEDNVNLLLNALYAIFDTAIKEFPNEKQFIYDSANIGFSNILHNLAPEFEIHPELDPTAILKAEDELINKLANNG